tara:strand:- start:671 stop:901 length:231 start_codon:yes stop_codon:yes gene_type:complete
MDIQAEKLHLIQWLIELNDESMIEKLKALREEKPIHWEELSLEEQLSINKGISEVRNGEVEDRSEVREQLKRKFNL